LREEKTLSHKREKEIKLEFFNSDFEGEIAKSIYFTQQSRVEKKEKKLLFQPNVDGISPPPKKLCNPLPLFSIHM